MPIYPDMLKVATLKRRLRMQPDRKLRCVPQCNADYLSKYPGAFPAERRYQSSLYLADCKNETNDAFIRCPESRAYKNAVGRATLSRRIWRTFFRARTVGGEFWRSPECRNLQNAQAIATWIEFVGDTRVTSNRAYHHWKINKKVVYGAGLVAKTHAC